MRDKGQQEEDKPGAGEGLDAPDACCSKGRDYAQKRNEPSRAKGLHAAALLEVLLAVFALKWSWGRDLRRSRWPYPIHIRYRLAIVFVHPDWDSTMADTPGHKNAPGLLFTLGGIVEDWPSQGTKKKILEPSSYSQPRIFERQDSNSHVRASTTMRDVRSTHKSK